MTRRYPLRHGEPKRLTIHFKPDGTDLHVLLDENEVHPVPASRDDDFRLPDGSPLTVNWVDAGHGNFDIQPILNAKVLPGSSLDPLTQVQVAAVTTGVLAAATLGVALVRLSTIIPGVPVLLDRALLLLGGLLGVLAIGIYKHLRTAVALAFALATVEALAVVFTVFPYLPRFEWLMLPFIPLPLIGQALLAIGELQEEAAASAHRDGIGPR